jgi:hypothetical protein
MDRLPPARKPAPAGVAQHGGGGQNAAFARVHAIQHHLAPFGAGTHHAHGAAFNQQEEGRLLPRGEGACPGRQMHQAGLAAQPVVQCGLKRRRGQVHAAILMRDEGLAE